MHLRLTNTRAHKRTYTYKQLQTYVHIFAHKKMQIPFTHFFTLLHVITVTDNLYKVYFHVSTQMQPCCNMKAGLMEHLHFTNYIYIYSNC